MKRGWGESTIARIGLRKLKANGTPKDVLARLKSKSDVDAELQKIDALITIDDVIQAFSRGEEVRSSSVVLPGR